MSDNVAYSEQTQVDLRSPWADRPRLVPRTGSSGPAPLRPSLRPVTQRIDPGNTLKSASLNQVLCRETTVRRNHQLLSPTLVEAPLRSRGVVRLPIDWVRGDDQGQQIRLVGRDGFQIKGLATGARFGAAATFRVGLEGLIHRVSVPPGSGAAETLERLLARLRDRYLFEIKEFSSEIALARVVGVRRSHT